MGRKQFVKISFNFSCDEEVKVKMQDKIIHELFEHENDTCDLLNSCNIIMPKSLQGAIQEH